MADQELVRSGVKKLIDAVTSTDADAERALQAVECGPELLAVDAVKKAHALLRELVGQDFDIDEDRVPRLHRGTRSDRILTVHDTAMRHGRKSQHQRFDGFKLHAAATNSEEPLLTAIEVEPANEQDGPHAASLVSIRTSARDPSASPTPPTGPAQSELSSRNSTLRCLRRCPKRRCERVASQSATSRSTSTPAPAPARLAINGTDQDRTVGRGSGVLLAQRLRRLPAALSLPRTANASQAA